LNKDRYENPRQRRNNKLGGSMYKVIHVYSEKKLEKELCEAAEEGYAVALFQAYEGSEDFHYVAILVQLEDEEELEEE